MDGHENKDLGARHYSREQSFGSRRIQPGFPRPVCHSSLPRATIACPVAAQYSTCATHPLRIPDLRAGARCPRIRARAERTPHHSKALAHSVARRACCTRRVPRARTASTNHRHLARRRSYPSRSRSCQAEWQHRVQGLTRELRPQLSKPRGCSPRRPVLAEAPAKAGILLMVTRPRAGRQSLRRRGSARSAVRHRDGNRIRRFWHPKSG